MFRFLTLAQRELLAVFDITCCLQNECPQGRVTGSFNTPAQEGQLKGSSHGSPVGKRNKNLV